MSNSRPLPASLTCWPQLTCCITDQIHTDVSFRCHSLRTSCVSYNSQCLHPTQGGCFKLYIRTTCCFFYPATVAPNIVLCSVPSHSRLGLTSKSKGHRHKFAYATDASSKGLCALTYTTMKHWVSGLLQLDWRHWSVFRNLKITWKRDLIKSPSFQMRRLQ